MNRILITGGAGFIGSHVAEVLLAAGTPVRVVDNFSTGKRENLAHLSGDLEIVEADLLDADRLPSFLDGVSAVVHLAAMVSVPKSVIDPIGSHRINYEATLSLLEAMRAADVPRIVYASSAAVYPTDNANPHSETDYPDPSSPYGIDKLAGEFALNAYARLYGIKTTALRFFNIYGERQDPTSAYSGVISIFADRIKSGRPLTIFGDGSQSRDFVYVRDLAALIARLAGDHAAPSRMNVGTGHSVTLNELVGLMQSLTGTTADVSYAEGRPGDIKISRADVTRLKAYHPVEFTSLETGLRSLLSSL